MGLKLFIIFVANLLSAGILIASPIKMENTEENVWLGQLYDGKNDKFLTAGISDAKLSVDFIFEQDNYKSEFTTIEVSSLNDMTKLYSGSLSSAINILGGTASASAGGSFLFQNRNFATGRSLITKGVFKIKKENLLYQTPEYKRTITTTFFNNHGTHFVAAIEYKVTIYLDVHISGESSDEVNGGGAMFSVDAALPFASVNVDAHFTSNSTHNNQNDNMRISAVADIPCPAHFKDIEEAGLFLNQIWDHIRNQPDYKGMPSTIWLEPVGTIYKMFNVDYTEEFEIFSMKDTKEMRDVISLHDNITSIHNFMIKKKRLFRNVDIISENNIQRIEHYEYSIQNIMQEYKDEIKSTMHSAKEEEIEPNFSDINNRYSEQVLNVSSSFSTDLNLMERKIDWLVNFGKDKLRIFGRNSQSFPSAVNAYNDFYSLMMPAWYSYNTARFQRIYAYFIRFKAQDGCPKLIVDCGNPLHDCPGNHLKILWYQTGRLRSKLTVFSTLDHTVYINYVMNDTCYDCFPV